MTIYRHVGFDPAVPPDRWRCPDSTRPLSTPGPVLAWERQDDGNYNAVVFSCPCGRREVYVTRPPHSVIRFDNGRLTIKASCGYREMPQLGRPANWCHFWMTAGQIEMCGDARCPGGDGSIP